MDSVEQNLINIIGIKNAKKLAKQYIKKYNTLNEKDFKNYHKWSRIYDNIKTLT